MSVDFYCYDANGEITITGSCPDSFLSLQERDGLTLAVGLASLDSHYVDADGLLCAAVSPRPTRQHRIDRSTGLWVDTRLLADIKAQALLQVDDLAGSARLRYITSVPGQAETYQKKEQQAREWAASSFTGEPPSFIAAEAQALNVSGQSVALEVIGLADFWSNIKGPQIEATRRKWKVAIEAASDPSLIQGLVDAARAELDAL